MLKKVAGGRVEARSEPGMKIGGRAGSDYFVDCEGGGGHANANREQQAPQCNADERSFRKFKRGVMTSPVRNVSQRLCVDLPPQSVIGTEPAAFAA